jgi:hypothetical protein
MLKNIELRPTGNSSCPGFRAVKVGRSGAMPIGFLRTPRDGFIPLADQNFKSVLLRCFRTSNAEFNRTALWKMLDDLGNQIDDDTLESLGVHDDPERGVWSRCSEWMQGIGAA